MMPVQKSGTDTPNWLNSRAAWSTNEPLRTAESTPRGKATSRASSTAVTASDPGGGQRSSTIRGDRPAAAEADP